MCNGKVGLITVNYDDESFNQINYLKKIIERTNKNVTMNNISELKLVYAKDKDGKCLPRFKLFDQEV